MRKMSDKVKEETKICWECEHCAHYLDAECDGKESNCNRYFYMEDEDDEYTDR